MKPKFRFVTFGDGSHGWTLAGKRLAREAHRSGFFESIAVYKLQDVVRGFNQAPRRDFFSSTRGYGYWSWKSLAVKKALQELPSSYDGIVYLDAGCTLNSNPDSSRRMSKYFEMTLGTGGLAFQLKGIQESKWTKRDLGLELDVIDAELWTSDQLAGGITFWNSSQRSKAIANEWVDLSFRNNMHLIDDTPSVSTESPEFIEHRHDQSIISLLAKHSGHFSILQNETEWSPDWLSAGYGYPIWATRHRSGLDFKLNQLDQNRVWLRRGETAKALICDIVAGIGR